MANFSKRSLDNLKGVHPDLVRLMNEAIKNTPVDFTITEGVRTVSRQQELYAQGRTAPGAKVTNVDGVRVKSNHQPQSDGYSHAVDLYPYVGGSVRVEDVVNLKRAAAHIKYVAQQIGVRISWGGDWAKLKDYPHFELA